MHLRLTAGRQRPWVAGAISLFLLVALSVGSPSDGALIIGAGVGRLSDPIFLTAAIVVAFAARRTWQVMTYAAGVTIVYHIIYLTLIAYRRSEARGVLLFAGVIGSFLLITVFCGLLDGVRAFVGRGSSTSRIG